MAATARVAYGVEFATVPPPTRNLIPVAPGGWTALAAPDGAWAGPAVGDAPAALDADGWPTSDAYIVALYAPASPVDPLHFVPPSFFGEYVLTWSGNATVVVGPGANATLSRVAFNASAFTGSAVITLGPPVAVLAVGFAATRRNASAPPNSGVTRVALWQPGTAPAPVALAAAPGAPAPPLFAPATIAALRPFAHARLMQWTCAWFVRPWDAAPDHGVVGWSGRALPSDAVWLTPGATRPATAFGAPWESVVALAQEAGRGAGVWINVPVQATGTGPTAGAPGSYVASLAALLRDGNADTGGAGVPPDAPIYVEHGNEVWLNGSQAAGGGPSGCYAWNKAAAAAEVAAGGSNLAADGVADPEVWAYRRHARALVEIGAAFAGVFGGGAMLTRVRPVLGWTAAFAAEGDALLRWVNDTLGVRPAAAFYGVAVNAYVLIPVQPGDGTDAMAAAWVAASDAARPARDAAAAAFAVKWGLALLTYEGSLVGIPVGQPDTLNATTAAVIAANRAKAYGAAMTHDARVNWEPLPGAAAYNFFALSSQYGEDAPVQQFQWGLTEDVHNLTSAKFRAAAALAAGASPRGLA